MSTLLPPLDCKSDEGITVGLIDALMSLAAVLRGRDLTGPHSREALKDLSVDQDLTELQLMGANFALEDVNAELRLITSYSTEDDANGEP